MTPVADIRSLLRELRIPFREPGQHHHARPGNIVTDCPQCSPNTNRFRLCVHTTRFQATCWSCGKVWLARALAQLSGRKTGEIRALLPESRQDAPQTLETPAGTYSPPPGVGPLRGVQRAYLARRGIDPDYAAETWGVCGIGPLGRLAWRLFLPVRQGGREVSWTTRAVGAGMRYVSASGGEESVPLKHCLYGEEHVRNAVLVTEGPFDALRIGPGAVATFGLMFTRAQVLRLSKYAIRAVLFDSEPAAQRRASELADQLAVFGGVTHLVRLTTAKDPGAASADEIRELRRRFLE